MRRNGTTILTSRRPRTVSPRFGQVALRLGYVSPEILAECLEEQRRNHARNETPLRIGQLLLIHGAITVDQLREVIREQRNEGGRPFRIGRFEILREVARGGMGVVYEAVEPRTGGRFALKVLRYPTCGTEEIWRLRNEARLTMKLIHPNIVRVHEIASVQGCLPGMNLHYMVMDFHEGGTLDDALRRLPLEAKLRILEEIAGAVGYAHRKGVVHRDLKPGNILLTKEGRPMLTDFGLAHDFSTSLRITPSGVMVGTPLYASPETIRCERGIGPPSDVWALGVILYEMLTGSAPFGSSETISTVGLYQQILTADLLLPNCGVAPDLAQVCRTSLEKNPAKRYPTANEFAEALRRCREGMPKRARASGFWIRLGAKLRRYASL